MIVFSMRWSRCFARGPGVSSDMESTIVPQLLSEIDGVRENRDMLVIGSATTEHLIDLVTSGAVVWM